jgi:metal-responsive CopG/Arc/MetJ family transcriptional regulator
MGVKKIAISVPAEVLKNVDRLARQSKTTRSGLISRVLREVSHAHHQHEITESINRLFEDPESGAEQLKTANFYLRAAEGDDSEWE